MSDKSVIFANATALSRSSKLLNHERIMRMLDCKNPLDAIKVLSEVNFGEGEVVENAYEFEKIIGVEERNLLDFIKEYAPEEKISNVFEMPFYFNNLKAVFKAKYGRKSDLSKYTFSYGGNVEEMKEKIFQDDYSSFSKYVSEASESVDNLRASGTLTPRKIDALFDAALYKERDEALKDFGYQRLRKYYSVTADAINFATFARCKNALLPVKQFEEMFLPSGTVTVEELKKHYDSPLSSLVEEYKYTEYNDLVKTLVDCFTGVQPLFKYEVKADNVQLDVFKKDKYVLDGFDPFLSYIVAKLQEIKDVRIVLVALQNGFDKGNTLERLRDLYV